jgi:hypothetical protein
MFFLRPYQKERKNFMPVKNTPIGVSAFGHAMFFNNGRYSVSVNKVILR